jgi:hypothetical protein
MKKFLKLPFSRWTNKDQTNSDQAFWLETNDDRLRSRLRQSRITSNEGKPVPTKIAPLKKLRLGKAYLKGKPGNDVSVKTKKDGRAITIKVPQTLTLRLPGKSALNRFNRYYRQKLAGIFTTKKRIAATIAITLALVSLLFVPNMLQKDQQFNQDASDQKPATEKAGFSVLVPAKNAADKDRGLTYIEDKKIIRFEDDFFGKSIIVSEQSLKDTPALDDPSVIIKAANSIGAKRNIETEKGQLFLGAIPDTTTQLGVIKYKHLLVFLRSETQLDDETWQDYIKTLVMAQ